MKPLELRDKKIILFIFLLAFIPRIIALAYLLMLGPGYLDASDGSSYIQPAINLINNFTFSIDTGAPPYPDNFRTPIYPFFLLPFIYFKIPFFVTAIVQIIIFGAIMVMAYFMGRTVFEEKTARWAVIFTAIEPHSIFSTNFITAQNLNYLFLLPSILFALMGIKTEKTRYFYFSAALLALSALTKPVTLALSPLLILSLAFSSDSFKKIIKTTIIALVIFAAITSPWLIRNKISLGTWQFSSIANHNLYFGNLNLFGKFYNLQDNPEAVAEPPLVKPYDTLVLKEAGLKARKFIMKHFYEYAFFVLALTPRLFIQDGYVDLLQMFFAKPLLSASPNLYTFLMQRDFSSFLANLQILLTAPAFSVYIAGKIIWLTITAGLIVAGWKAAKDENKKRKKIIFWCLIFLLWYAFLHSPLGRVGYRYPLHFFIFAISLEYFLIPLTVQIKAKLRQILPAF